MQFKTGGYYPPVFYENILVFCADDQWSPLQVWWILQINACKGGYYPPDVLRVVEAPTPTDLYDICYFNCRGDHNVFEENLRLAKGSPADVQCTPLQICAIFVILIVGATIGRPSFIKISFCLKRTVEDACPYKI